jgi:hypothetical protein
MVGDIKNIIVIQSLGSYDKKTGEELYNDTIKRHIDYTQPENLKMNHYFHDVKDKNSLIEILKYYSINTLYMNGGVLIHFEMHGSVNKDGLILADNSLITWEEITEFLRIINLNINNRLYITMATCFGRYLYLGTTLDKKSPYSGYISASKEVMVEEIMADFTLLFEILIKSGNLVFSYLELDKNGSNFYYKDSKAVFEENFETFKKNIEFKTMILKSAKEKLFEQYGNIEVNEVISEMIYHNALNEAHQNQRKSFLFE